MLPPARAPERARERRGGRAGAGAGLAPARLAPPSAWARLQLVGLRLGRGGLLVCGAAAAAASRPLGGFFGGRLSRGGLGCLAFSAAAFAASFFWAAAFAAAPCRAWPCGVLLALTPRRRLPLSSFSASAAAGFLGFRGLRAWAPRPPWLRLLGPAFSNAAFFADSFARQLRAAACFEASLASAAWPSARRRRPSPQLLRFSRGVGGDLLLSDSSSRPPRRPRRP